MAFSLLMLSQWRRGFPHTVFDISGVGWYPTVHHGDKHSTVHKLRTNYVLGILAALLRYWGMLIELKPSDDPLLISLSLNIVYSYNLHIEIYEGHFLSS